MTVMAQNGAPARLPSLPEIETRLPIRLSAEGDGSVLNIVFRIAGTGLILTAPALWVLPGSDVTADMLLMKFGVSLFFFLCGLALLMRNHSDAQPMVYFDPIRREMRILQLNDRGRPETILRRSYDSLGAAHITGNSVELWDVDGSVLMRLPLRDAETRQALRMQLSGLVRIKA